jgi:ABC-type transport system substrate-binding protein
MQAIQSYLKAVGIDAQIEAVDSARYGQMIPGAGGKNISLPLS